MPSIKDSTTGEGARPVYLLGNPTTVEVSATPTVDTSIFASGDVLHSTIMTFSGAVRAAGATGTILGFTLMDFDVEKSPLELWLFTTSATIPTANAAWSITDADMQKCIGVLPTGVYYASALNAIAKTVPLLPFKADAAETAIYGALVTRGTPTYTAGTDIKVVLQIAQD